MERDMTTMAGIWKTCLVAGVMLARAGWVPAADLGSRVVWDGLTMPAAGWETAAGITMQPGADTLTMSAGPTTDFGWANPAAGWPLTAGMLLDLDCDETVKVQLDWFRKDQQFLEASRLPGGKIVAQPLLKWVPRGERPRFGRLKFWIQGAGQSAQIRRVRVVMQRAWRDPATRLVATYGPKSKRTAEPGMEIIADRQSLGLGLGLGTQFSALVFTPRVAADPRGVVLVDLVSVAGGRCGVQALCWAKDGTYLGAVDLWGDITEGGVYEIPFAAMGRRIPPATAEFSFKVGLRGADAAVRLGLLAVGVLP